jgi:hypothetical protein
LRPVAHGRSSRIIVDWLLPRILQDIAANEKGRRVTRASLALGPTAAGRLRPSRRIELPVKCADRIY